MAIFNIYFDLDKEYTYLIHDIYKGLCILIVFQILVHYSSVQKNVFTTALTGKILNDDFIGLLFFIILGFSAYHLVFDKIIHIHR
jgi:hypothetical protein